MISPRAIAFTLFLLALVLTGTGCPAQFGSEPDADVTKGGTAVFGYQQEPEILNPYLSGGEALSTGDIAENIIPGLFRLRPDFTYEPYLLEKEPTKRNGGITESPQTITYVLRKGLMWSDGKPITTKDIRFTWKTIMEPKNKISTRAGYDKIQSITLPDKRTAIVTFKEPYAAWRDLFSKGALAGILPEHLLKGKDFNQEMLHTIDFSGGPFIFDEWSTGNSLTLARNDKFWGKKPHLDKVVFKFLADLSVEREQLRNEQVDIIAPSSDSDLLAQLRKLPGITVQVGAGTFWEQIGLNTARPPLTDPNVRKAIAYAIDRRAITSGVAGSSVKTLHSVILPNLKDYSSPTFEIYSKNVEQARALLQASGWMPGIDGVVAKGGLPLSIRLSTTAGDPDREKVVQIIAENLKAVGVASQIVNSEEEAFFGRLIAGDFDLAIWAWPQSADPSITTILASDQVPPAGQNAYLYRNADVTALLHQSDIESDPAERARQLKDAQTRIASDVPLLPLYQRPAILAFTERLHGPRINTTVAGPTWNMSDWWLESGQSGQ